MDIFMEWLGFVLMATLSAVIIILGEVSKGVFRRMIKTKADNNPCLIEMWSDAAWFLGLICFLIYAAIVLWTGDGVTDQSLKGTIYFVSFIALVCIVGIIMATYKNCRDLWYPQVADDY